MARVRLSTAALVLGGTLVASFAAGYGWSRLNDDTPDDTVRVSEPGIYDEPGSIVTAPELGGDPLPSVELSALDGSSVSTADLTGQPMVLNLWFSTCVPCQQELPDFATVSEEFANEVRFIGVNPFDTAETAASFAAEHGVTYELLLDTSSEFTSDLEIGLFPATLFVDAQGTIVDLHLGALTAAELREKIATELSA
ncbi:MAG: TlpA disulfide reductase family protein [Ilumatobacteraceae bacterium]